EAPRRCAACRGGVALDRRADTHAGLARRCRADHAGHAAHAAVHHRARPIHRIAAVLRSRRGRCPGRRRRKPRPVTPAPAYHVAPVPPGIARAGARQLAPAVVVVLVAGVLVVGGLVGPAWATDGRLRSKDDALAVSLLYRAMSAPDRVSHRGTQYVTGWSALDRPVSTSAVVDSRHVAGGDTVVTRHGARGMTVPSGDDSGSWLGRTGGPIGLLVRAYDVMLAGTAQ